MNMNKGFFISLLITGFLLSQSNLKICNYPLTAVSINDVILEDNFWLPKINTLQDSTIPYAFEKCEKEGRMENFLIAGKKKGGRYKSKFPFDDTDLYKIIEGASLTLISKPNSQLDSYLDSIIEIIKIGQESDGYITTWFTIDREHPPSSWVKPSKTRWENEISSHELYNSGHLFEAAAAHYWATGKKNFLNIAIKNADLLVENFGPKKLHTPPGHQIVETGLIKLYQITKNEKYLNLAKFFLDIRGDSTTHDLFGEYSQDHLPVTEQSEAVGHAVRAMYMYAGMTDVGVMFDSQDYINAVNKIWENIVNKKMYITGGLGSRHRGEAFGNDYELPNLTAYGETCAAIGSVLWNYRLFLLTGNSKYFDIIERTLYNGLISGISLNGKLFFYTNPLESDAQFKFNEGSCSRESWFDCSCCPTNLIRFIPSIPSLFYAISGENLYVNLFASSKSNFLLGGSKIEITQRTDYPLSGKIEITIHTEKTTNFNLFLRLPGWAQKRPIPSNLYSYLDSSISSTIDLYINGQKENINYENGYAKISRLWHDGDKIEMNHPMEIHKVIADQNVKEDSGKVAFEFGPFVYCAEEIDNKNISSVIIPNSFNLIPEKRIIGSEKLISLKGKLNGRELILIPYYLWSNRGIGKMKVWFPRNNE